jgi:hypothetical protein
MLEQLFHELKSVNKTDTLKINAARVLLSGVIWFIVTGVFGSGFEPIAIPAAVSALGAGMIAHALSKIGVPFAGLFAILFACYLLVADPFLKVFLAKFGDEIGLPYELKWLNLSLLIFARKPVNVDDDVLGN